MGGSAFSAGETPLFTPRMPRQVYLAVKEQCHAALQGLYLCVASPIDGPGKEDFGDVDILVTWPKTIPNDKQETLNAISSALQATQMIVDKGTVSAHFALPWPEETTMPQEIHEATEAERKFVQVDVRVCESLDQLQWMLFKHANGDIWNLLGTTIRPYGLSVDEEALWLRIPEIENAHRNRAKVFLTSDPAEVLHFLDLPIGEYWSEPFEDLDAMYEYVARCRLFWVYPLDPEEEGVSTSLEQDRKKLKANDRKRMNQRPGFRRWVEEFKPKCREQRRFLVKPTSREAVTDEAFAWFHVEREFVSRRDEFLLEKNRDMVWRTLIKGSIADADVSDPRSILYRSCLVKALKRIILDGDDRYGILPDKDLKDKEGFYNVEDVIDFIARNQDEVGKAAFDLNHGNYLDKLKAKAAKKEKEAATAAANDSQE